MKSIIVSLKRKLKSDNQKKFSISTIVSQAQFINLSSNKKEKEGKKTTSHLVEDFNSSERKLFLFSRSFHGAPD